MATDLSKLDLLIIQIDGLHIGNDLVLVAALGIDGNGDKHPLGLVEGATENTAVVQALIDNLIERGLDPKVCRLFIIDGAKRSILLFRDWSAILNIDAPRAAAHLRRRPRAECSRAGPWVSGVHTKAASPTIERWPELSARALPNKARSNRR